MSEPAGPQLGRLGMKLLLLSLSVLFAASLVGVLIIRWRAPVWPPEGAPELPAGLWWSTAIILLSSWVLSAGQRRARSGGPANAYVFLVACLVLALAFFANQAINWLEIAPMIRKTPMALYGFSFLMLTVLHALHVFGGLVSLGIVTAKARKNTLTPSGLSYAAMYWHFLTMVWLVIFLVLELLF